MRKGIKTETKEESYKHRRQLEGAKKKKNRR
jgi:hypothetical protein